MESEGYMSCKCNGISMCEGRLNLALMPAIVTCDNRHAIDPRPLTREQIERIPGVRFPAKIPPKPAEAAVNAPSDVTPATPRTTQQERQRMINLFLGGFRVCEIEQATGRNKSSIREILAKAGIHGKQRERRIAK